MSYRDAFVQFIDYMRTVNKVNVERLTLDKLTKDAVTGYLAWIINERKCGIATRNYRLAAMHSFVRYLQYEDIGRLEKWQSILSIKAMKDGIKPVNYLSTEGIKLLLNQPDMETRNGRRHLALLSLLYDTGARVQELIDLTPGALRIATEPYTIRLYGKGRKSRIVPLVREQVTILKLYMEENDLFEDRCLVHPLFYNSKGERLTRAGVTYILKTYADMARKERPDIIPDRLSCHSLRHSKSMHLLQAGVNLVYLRDILGHVSIQTTDVYARADSKQKREALEKAYTDLTPDCAKDRKWERDKNLLDWLKGLHK
jgi:site-specific recombinase XerD